MKRALRLFILVLLVLSAFSIPVSSLAASARANVASPYIVTLNPTSRGAALIAAALGQQDGFQVEHSFDTVIKGFSARLTPAQVSVLRTTSSVTGIAPDLPTHISSQAIPTGVERIGTLSNSTANIGGGGLDQTITAATLDTGIDPNNADLNVVGGYNCSSSNTSAWHDDNGHGTHVAGTIAAKDDNQGVVGVAPGADLYAVKVFNSQGSGYVSWIICGINWIMQHNQAIGAGNSGWISTVNFSGAWAGYSTANCGMTNFFGQQVLTDPAHQAVCNLVNSGVPFVVAAGNSGTDASSTLPAAYPETIAVGAIADSDGKPLGLGPATSYGADDTRATFSNYGPAVTIYAPGVDILSDWIGNCSPNVCLNTISGTSMATPHVTGAVLLYLLNHQGLFSTPSAIPGDVQEALVANGEPGSWGAPYGNQPLLNVDNAAFGAAPPAPVHDVEVTSLTAPSPLVVGQQGAITAQLDNQGNQNESGLTVTLKDGSTAIDTATNIPLSAGAQTDVTLNWTPPDTNQHTLTVSVSGSAIPTKSLSNTFSAANVIHEVDVMSVAPQSTPFDGIANVVNVTVENNGNQVESGLTVNLTDNGTSITPNQSVSGSLLPGDSATVSFPWTPSGTGNHTLIATVSNGDIAASQGQVTVSVTTQTSPQNIWVASLTATNPAHLEIAGQVSIAGGTGPIAGATVTLTINGGSIFTGKTTQTITVTTGTNGSAAYSVLVPFTSTYTIAVTNAVHGADNYAQFLNKSSGVRLSVS